MPTTVGGELTKLELWEIGRRRLGYGDWDAEPDNPEPYPKWAGMQAHRLYLSMRKRRASQADFIICVEYCHRHHVRIENATWVFQYYPLARKEQMALDSLTPTRTDELIELAVRREQMLMGTDPEAVLSGDWINRLSRAQAQYRVEVLAEWAKQRNVDLTLMTA